MAGELPAGEWEELSNNFNRLKEEAGRLPCFFGSDKLICRKYTFCGKSGGLKRVCFRNGSLLRRRCAGGLLKADRRFALWAKNQNVRFDCTAPPPVRKPRKALADSKLTGTAK